MDRASVVRAAALAAHNEIREMASRNQGDLAIHFFRSFVAHGGLVLDPEIWSPGAPLRMAQAIELALGSGRGAARVAMELVTTGAIHDLIHSHIDPLVTNTDCDPVQSVLRTEINRAHGEAFMAAGERTPGFAGWRFLLSTMHPAPDICDLLAAQNLHGLGPGVYPDRASCPWPAHLNTLSFVEIVFQDEITDANRAGKETELQALQRLAPGVRAIVQKLLK